MIHAICFFLIIYHFAHGNIITAIMLILLFPD